MTINLLATETPQDRLIRFIRQFVPLDQDSADYIGKTFMERPVRANDVLLKTGRVCNEFLFVATGTYRAFTHDLEGNDVTT
ncbi:MAG: hypothetical protein H7Z72_13140 [Bacteroidetes bacterium]|nr:hypothetical protein [Fibrella sp.]